jgi:Mrp family chromosome partitioning ATPase/capsular polysaccharide biosynthesis protein
MNGERQSGVAEPNVLTSIWNHKILVGVFVGVFAVLGVLVNSLRPSQYAAEAGVVLEDPQTSVFSDPRPAGDELRYVADQVSILKSFALAEKASAVAAAPPDPKNIAPGYLRRHTTINTSADSNYITVSTRASNPDTAAAGANAIVRAYQQLIRADLEADTAAALKRVDQAIAAATLNLGQPGAQALLDELRLRRNRLVVNSELSGDGVALFSPAGPGKPQGVSSFSALVIAMVLGGLIAAGLAYWLDARTQAFSSWLEPQVLLDAPALAEVPDFRREGLGTDLPVLHAQETEAAEAFRLLASGIGVPRESQRKLQWVPTTRERVSGSTARAARSVAFVSATFGDGTSTLAANTALAAAQEGHRVLALDADVQRHGLSRLLLGEEALTIDGAEITPVGFSDMLQHGATAESIRRVMTTGAGGTLSLLGPGTATLRQDDVFRSEQILATLDSIRDQFDLIIMDVPPILHVAYADALLRSAEAVAVIVRHRSAAARLRHVLNRLELLGVRPIGYVYNFAPSRREVSRSVAQEMLGRAELVVEIARARAKKTVAK